MSGTKRFTVTSALTLLIAFAGPGAVAAQADAAHRHIGHVADEWRDTPDQVGLLTAAQAEAEVAVQHARLAASGDDLATIQRHTRHVVHAIDPTAESRGPGSGYGLINAAEGVARHITLAAESDGASDNVKRHAEHVSTSARNAVAWSKAVLEHAEAIAAAADPESASELASEIEALTSAIAGGMDADGDGSTSWREGEGGLQQAAQHVALMKRGEGMS
jgi:hypothetical protein